MEVMNTVISSRIFHCYFIFIQTSRLPKRRTAIYFIPLKTQPTFRLTQKTACLYQENYLVNTVKEKQFVVYCENHTDYVNTTCGENAEFFNIKPAGTYNDHRALEDYRTC
jgi:hypothetical protein